MASIKVMLCQSSHFITNGYSYVGYNLAKHIATKKDIDLIYWGFQKFQDNPEHNKQRELPSNVTVYDAWANENPKGLGFGFDQIVEYVNNQQPNVIMIYNDFVVVSNIIEKLKTCTFKGFKVIIYIDQVYLSQKKEFIKRLNDHADFVITFTPYWSDILKEQGMSRPTDFLQHGFDPLRNYPVPKKLARIHFGLKQEDFIVINTCRNQPRKRLDYMMIAWAEFVSRHQCEPVKLLIGTHPTNGSWNLLEIYERELRLRGMTMEEGMKHIILIDNPQQLTDEDLNTLYNVADVGINTTMGAGFELTNFEHGGIGCPQIAPHIGGIRDFLDNTCAKVIQPTLPFYTDTSYDGCPGCAQLCNPTDYADALDEYYADEELRKTHGDKCRERILKNYKWEDLGEKFYGIIKNVAGVVDVPDVTKISLDDIANLEKNLNINIPMDTTPTTPTEPVVAPTEPVVAPTEPVANATNANKSHEGRKEDIKSNLSIPLPTVEPLETNIFYIIINFKP
jgi:glycosyltransferase involved in cell wall biosynthesis